MTEAVPLNTSTINMMYSLPTKKKFKIAIIIGSFKNDIIHIELLYSIYENWNNKKIDDIYNIININELSNNTQIKKSAIIDTHSKSLEYTLEKLLNKNSEELINKNNEKLINKNNEELINKNNEELINKNNEEFNSSWCMPFRISLSENGPKSLENHVSEQWRLNDDQRMVLNAIASKFFVTEEQIINDKEDNFVLVHSYIYI
eukprot:GHVL01038935.1.p3 GENE.GHVL01038935.1~~GHVL01038935.1.p3  ORF type:complete len:203 (+),score=71.28 GHVL01038935.1:1357-1965(+)